MESSVQHMIPPIPPQAPDSHVTQHPVGCVTSRVVLGVVLHVTGYMARRAVRPVLLRAIVCTALLLAAGWTAAEAGAERPTITVSGEMIGFADERLSDLYGTRPGLGFGIDLVDRRWIVVGLHGSYSFGDADPGAPDIITSSKLKMKFVPIRLYARAIHRGGPRWQVYGGPQIGYAWFEETWKAYVGSVDEIGYHKATGSWFGFGAGVGFRWRLSSTGGLALGGEYMISNADREAVPGTTAQNTDMDAGWYSVRLGWFFWGRW